MATLAEALGDVCSMTNTLPHNFPRKVHDACSQEEMRIPLARRGIPETVCSARDWMLPNDSHSNASRASVLLGELGIPPCIMSCKAPAQAHE